MPVRLNTTQHLGSQHLGLPLAFGKLLLSTRWSRAEVMGAGVSEAKGSCSQGPAEELPYDCTKNQSFILFIYCKCV